MSAPVRADSAILSDLIALAKSILDRPTPDYEAPARLASLRAEINRSLVRPTDTPRHVNEMATVLCVVLDEIVHTQIGTARRALLRTIARATTDIVADDAHEALKLEHMQR